MAAASYWWRATWRRGWRSSLVIVALCALLGTVALGALAGARRTESAYGRYLSSVNASDAMVNVPSPDTSLDARVAALPGVVASAAWVGLDANPVFHGRVDDSFLDDNLVGSLSGAFFTQDRATVLSGRLPTPRSTDEVALTPGLARLFGVGVGGRVTYQLLDALSPTNQVLGYRTFTVTGIIDVPPALVDQFDQVQAAILPTAATNTMRQEFEFSWVGVRLRSGSAELPALKEALAHLEATVGGGYVFAIRQMDLVHQEVQAAIRPQAVALAVLGALSALALLVLAGQAMAQRLDRSGSEMAALRVLGMSRLETALAGTLGPAVSIIVGVGLAVLGAFAVSPLAPVGPVRRFDPARGLRFDLLVLLAGGAVLVVALLTLLGLLAWRSVRRWHDAGVERLPLGAAAAASIGLPASVALGARYALEPAPGRRPTAVRANLVGSVIAVTAVVTAVVFGASLNGLVSHPARYGWNWSVLFQTEGGYGSFLPLSVNATNVGEGDGVLDRVMPELAGVRSWSTFGFTQLTIDGQLVPVLGLATHGGEVEPPTVSGRPLDDTGAVPIGGGSISGPDEIEMGATTLHQLGKQVGQTVLVGTGRTARRLTIVGVVTLPSIGVALSDHVSLGRGAMLPESTLLGIVDFSAISPNAAEAFSALPSTLAVDLEPGTDATTVEDRILAADPGGIPGGFYVQPRVLGAPIVNAAQMGSQPLTLAIALALAVLISLSATIVAGARRRRRDFAVLKALGMIRRQVRSVIAWQSVTLLLIAVIVGVPLGIAAGHGLWVAFASSIGVVPVTVTPVAALVVGALVLAAVASLLITTPGVMVADRAPAATLRTE